jgi:hypothetical protein
VTPTVILALLVLAQAGASAAQKCKLRVAGGETTRAVLQSNGSADDVVHAVLCPAEPLNGAPRLSMAGVVLAHHSSNPHVLRIANGLQKDHTAMPETDSDVRVDTVVVGDPATGCRNITLTFAFDRLVGKVNYSLSAIPDNDPGSTALCEANISFIVAGFSLYAEDDSALDRIVIHSGRFGRPVSLAYDESVPSPTRIFLVKTQYPAPSTAKPFLAEPHLLRDILSNLRIIAPSGDTVPIPVDPSVSALDFRPSADDWAGANMTAGLVRQQDSSSVAAGFSVGGASGGDLVSFGLRFRPYRAGEERLTFIWDGFSSLDERLEDERYMNFLDVNVTGIPPPAFLSIDNFGPLFRAGGDVIPVRMINVHGSVSRRLLVNGVLFQELPNGYKEEGDGSSQSTAFLSAPGEGVHLPWELHVTFQDGSTKSSRVLLSENISASLFYYETEDIHLAAVEPTSASERDLITLSGYFDAFNLNTSSLSDVLCAIYFNNISISIAKYVADVDPDGRYIRLLVPPRAEVGNSFRQNISVTVAGQTTIGVQFRYKAPNSTIELNIISFGTSYSAAKSMQEAGPCMDTMYLLSMPRSTAEPTDIVWFLSPVFKAEPISNMLRSYAASFVSRKVLVLPADILSNVTGIIQITAECYVDNQLATSSILVEKVSSLRIGATIFKPAARSIAIPNTPLLLSAVISPPAASCYNGTARIVYDWNVGNISKRFSYANVTSAYGGDRSQPSRLGREFVVPQTELRYGVLNISLHAFMEDDPVIFGIAMTTAVIQRPTFVAKIGNGEAYVSITTKSNYLVTALQSYDPDGMFSSNKSQQAQLNDTIISRSTQNINVYRWTCFISTTSTVSGPGIQGTSSAPLYMLPCGGGFLPDPHNPSFTISNTTLGQGFKEISRKYGTAGGFLLLYTLQVGNNDVRSLSPIVRQTLEVMSGIYPASTLSSISITDNQGIDFEWSRVPYYQDVLISPGGLGAEWKLTLRENASARGDLLLTIGVNDQPGYYDPRQSRSWQHYPLGIPAGALVPGMDYILEFDVSNAVTQRMFVGHGKIMFRTLEQPSLVFPDLPIGTGKPGTVFIASAGVGDMASPYQFLYFFYLTDEDGNTYCLDGCSGSPFVQFIVNRIGNYSVSCHLVDGQGSTTIAGPITNRVLLVVSNYVENFLGLGAYSLRDVAVRAASSLQSFEELLFDLYWSGDHGNIEFAVSSLPLDIGTISNGNTSDLEYSILNGSLTVMHQIVQNSAPTPRISKSYMNTASRLAAIDSDFFASEEALYSVLSMVRSAIANVPLTGSLDLQNELQSFFSRILPYVLDVYSGFSSRIRLQQHSPSRTLGAKVLVVDAFLLQQQLSTEVMARNAPCGMIKAISYPFKGGERAGSMNSMMRRTQLARHGNVPFDCPTCDPSSTGGDKSALLETWYANYAEASPVNVTVTVGVFCNPDQATALRGSESEFRWCTSVYDSNSSGSSKQQQVMESQKRVIFTLMESIDYLWLSGLGVEPADAPTLTRYLVSTNVSGSGLDGGSIRMSESSPAGCFAVNTSIPRFGLSPHRGCLGAEAFRIGAVRPALDSSFASTDYQRNFSGPVSWSLEHQSSTIEILSSGTGIFGAVGRSCPKDLTSPRVALPAGFKIRASMLPSGVIFLIVISIAILWVSMIAMFREHNAG